MPERRVLWASTAGPGGIDDYRRAIQQSPLWTDWNMLHIATHRAGSTAMKVAVFARGTALFAVALIRSRPVLVHLYAVDKSGSLSRNAILAWMSRLARVPVVFHVHATNLDAYFAKSPVLMRLLIQATLNRVDAVVVGAREDFDWHRLDALYHDVSAR